MAQRGNLRGGGVPLSPLPKANRPAPGSIASAEADAPRHSEQQVLLGIALRTAAVLALAAVSAGVKWLTAARMPLSQIIFSRNIFAFIPILIMVRTTVGFGALRTQRPLRHLTRSAIGLGAMICTFTSLETLPLVASATLGFTAPLFMTLLSMLVLRETVAWQRWAAVLVGFAGVVVAMHPGAVRPTVGVAWGLGAAFMTACAMISIRGMPKTESGPTIAFYFTVAGTLASLAGLPFGWITPGPTTLMVMIATGLAGGVAQLLLTTAVRLAPLPVLAPFDYTQLVWASSFGFLLWGERPDGWLLLGAAIVAGSGVYILWRERAAAREWRRG